jgi:hypothetical protein
MQYFTCLLVWILTWSCFLGLIYIFLILTFMSVKCTVVVLVLYCSSLSISLYYTNYSSCWSCRSVKFKYFAQQRHNLHIAHTTLHNLRENLHSTEQFCCTNTDIVYNTVYCRPMVTPSPLNPNSVFTVVPGSPARCWNGASSQSRG